MSTLYSVIDRSDPRYLLAYPDGETVAISCEPGDGVLTAGTVMYRTSSGMFAAAAEAECVATNYLVVLGQDVDISVDAKVAEDAMAYRKGNFIRGRVVLKESAQLKPAQEAVLRRQGIVFSTITGISYDNTVFGMEPAAMESTKQPYGSIKVSDMQDNIVIGEDAITGHLKHIKDFSSAGFGEAEKSGNFLALQFDIKDGVTTKTQVEGGDHGEVTLSAEDNFCVYRIKDKDKQKIKITREVGGKKQDLVYNLTGLICDKE